MKINNFRGDLTDISFTKEPLVQVHSDSLMNTRSCVFPRVRGIDRQNELYTAHTSEHCFQTWGANHSVARISTEARYPLMLLVLNFQRVRATPVYLQAPLFYTL